MKNFVTGLFAFLLVLGKANGDSLAIPNSPLYSPEKLAKTWAVVESKMKETAWTKGPMSAAFPLLFQSLNGKRIYSITRETAFELGKSVSLSDSPLGLYYPDTNEIYLRIDLEETELANALLHEITHAFQYLFRFPLDLQNAAILGNSDPTSLGVKRSNIGAKSSVMPLNEILNFLDFYYESQAHWYAISLGGNASWNQYWSQHLKMNKLANFPLIKFGKIPVVLVARLPDLLADDSNEESIYGERYLFLPKSQAFRQLEKLPHAYLLPELVYSSDPTFWAVIDSNKSSRARYILRFQAHLANSLINSYYGNEKVFLSSFKYAALLQSRLHNIFENQTRDLSESDVKLCFETLMSETHQGELAPLKYWVDLPGSGYQTCPLYKEVNKDLLQALMAAAQKTEPFDRFKRPQPGTEGSRGGIDLKPALHFHPQLNVKP